MTEHAVQFVAPLTFEALSGNRAITDMFDRNHDWEIGHISLAKKSDIFVVAPCTANLIGKLACGIADDFLSTTLMAAKCPILLAPAMNTGMLESAAYRTNEQTLRGRGILFVESGSGRLACGDEGKGRMAEPEQIAEEVVKILCPHSDYAGKTVLITSGGTREAIDPVRFLGNRSSGKMGAALAEAAFRRGAKVIYIAATGAVRPSAPVEIISVETTSDMYRAALERFVSADMAIMAAAPADYAPKQIAEKKIKDREPVLVLQKNPDIAAAMGKNKKAQKLIIFAAETENTVKNAKEKLLRKNADMAVANNVLEVGAGFDSDTNIVTLITRDDTTQLEKMPKSRLADVILDNAIRL